LWFSVLLRPHVGLARAGALGVLAGVAAAEAIGPPVMVKWPNDLVIGRRKVGGILVEQELRGNEIAFAVIGIGINVNFPLADLGVACRTLATTLLDERGTTVDRGALLVAILRRLEAWYYRWSAGDDVALTDRWRELDALAGTEVAVETPQGWCRGIAEGITTDGALLVRDDGLHAVRTGELTGWYLGDDAV
jgi:BirA family biotin operon repressor/biotin-[acetyl-CoA-carboxylase] ligase